jgi:Rad3-related DNA helicase
MSEIDSVEAASRRLALALDALEAAVERRRDADRSEEALAEQIHALGTDRARLAGELDAATALSRKLETSNREVAQRIDQAIETIRSVLDTPEGGE